MNATHEKNQQAVRALSDEEFDAVTGGIINGCIQYPTVLAPYVPSGQWTFKDVFAMHTL